MLHLPLRPFKQGWAQGRTDLLSQDIGDACKCGSDPPVRTKHAGLEEVTKQIETQLDCLSAFQATTFGKSVVRGTDVLNYPADQRVTMCDGDYFVDEGVGWILVGASQRLPS
jgi:hypothetical protein